MIKIQNSVTSQCTKSQWMKKWYAHNILIPCSSYFQRFQHLAVCSILDVLQHIHQPCVQKNKMIDNWNGYNSGYNQTRDRRTTNALIYLSNAFLPLGRPLGIIIFKICISRNSALFYWKSVNLTGSPTVFYSPIENSGELSNCFNHFMYF